MNAPGKACVLVLVVNFNAGNLLRRCIESLLNQDVPLEIRVLDNHSTDGSEAAAEAVFDNDRRVRIYRESSNLGFSAGVNRALQRAQSDLPRAPDYLLVINPDCLVEKGAVRALTDALAAHPSAAVAGPRVLDAQGRVQKATVRRFPDPWRALRTFTGLPGGVDQSHDLPEDVCEVEAISGACMMLPFSLWQELGGLDEAYAMHCEDLDLMYRARLAGHACLFVPGASVVHHQGQSSRSRPAWVHWQKHRGMQLFFNKFQGERFSLPMRLLVGIGIWTRFALTLPLQWQRK